MLKAGLVFNNLITTVSPRYALEIPQRGIRLRLRQHSGRPTRQAGGHTQRYRRRIWNPGTDRHLAQRYHVDGKIRAGKRANRQALLHAFDAPLRHCRRTAPGRQCRRQAGAPERCRPAAFEAILGLLDTTDALFVIIGPARWRWNAN